MGKHEMVEVEIWDGDVNTASNTLLLTPANVAVDDKACGKITAQSKAEAVLLITFDRSARDRLAHWNKETTTSNTEIRVISAGELTRSSAPEPVSTGPILPRIDTVDPTNLGNLGQCISAHLEDMEGQETGQIVCFHAIHSLIKYNEPEDVFKFLHLLAARIQSVDAIAHYHLDPSQVDWRDTLPLVELFDAIVAVNPDGRYDAYRERLGFQSGSRDNIFEKPAEKDEPNETEPDEMADKSAKLSISLATLVDLTPWIWTVAVLTYGIGDVATTLSGIQMGVAYEASPISAYLIEQHGIGVIYYIKVATFALFYFLWSVTPSPYNVGIPLGLAVLGTMITIWNFHIIILGLAA